MYTCWDTDLEIRVEVPIVWYLSVEYGGSKNCVTTTKNHKGVEAKGTTVNMKVQTLMSDRTASSSRPEFHFKIYLVKKHQNF